MHARFELIESLISPRAGNGGGVADDTALLKGTAVPPIAKKPSPPFVPRRTLCYEHARTRELLVIAGASRASRASVTASLRVQKSKGERQFSGPSWR
jgi:hypothetical protein